MSSVDRAIDDRIAAMCDAYLRDWPALVNSFRLGSSDMRRRLIDDVARWLISERAIEPSTDRVNIARRFAGDAFDRAVAEAPALTTREKIAEERIRRAAAGAAFADVLSSGQIPELANQSTGEVGGRLIYFLNGKGFDIVRKDPGNGQQPGNATKEHGNSGSEASDSRPVGTHL